MADSVTVNATPDPGPQPQASALPNQIPQPQATPSMVAGMTAPVGQAPQPPQMHPAVADAASHAMLGKAARFLLGNQVQYAVNPQTGQTEEQEVPQKPGQMMRSLVAGALLGSVAGSGGHGFLQGFARGGTAAQGQAQEQDAQRRQQAQQQFQNQMKAQQNQRETDAAATEDKLKQAQIALYNVQKMNENVALNGATFKQHQESADAGKHMLEPYATVEGYRYQDVSESNMHDLMSTNPEAAKLLWQPTGHRPVVDKDGNATTELTYSAVDPHGQVKVTQGMLTDFNKAKMGDYYPEVKGLKVGQTMDAQQMMTLQSHYQDLYNKGIVQQKNDLAAGKENAEIAKDKAEAAHWLAENAKSNQEKNRSELEAQALDELDKQGGDFSKLSPKHQAVIAQTIVPKEREDLLNEAKTELQAHPDDPDGRAKKALEQVDYLNTLVPKAFKPPVAATQLPKPPKPNAPIPDDVRAQYLKANNNNVEAAKKAAAADGWGPPVAAPTTGGGLMNTAKKVANLSVGDVVNAVKNVVGAGSSQATQ